MKSMVYQGFVEHIRHLPVHHKFRYPVHVYGLDVDELPALDRRLPLFGYNRLRPTTIYDADYLGGGPESFREKILGFLPAETAAATAAITMITSARHFHYIFNPVSFFYCTDAAGSTRAIVVEVNNTFGERHVYVPEKTDPDRDNRWIRGKSQKAFHVSPFNDMEGTYDFFFSPPGPKLDIRIHLIKNRKKTFEARLWGRGTALTAASHLRLLLRHPLRPHLTKPLIFRQAAALYFRKHLPYHEKPEPISPMTIRKKS